MCRGSREKLQGKKMMIIQPSVTFFSAVIFDPVASLQPSIYPSMQPAAGLYVFVWMSNEWKNWHIRFSTRLIITMKSSFVSRKGVSHKRLHTVLYSDNCTVCTVDAAYTERSGPGISPVISRNPHYLTFTSSINFRTGKSVYRSMDKTADNVLDPTEQRKQRTQKWNGEK